MNGLTLSERYFQDCGMPMLRERFPALLPYLAAGFVGPGSDRFGFDDEISRDHDYEPGFCLFLPGEDIVSRRDAFLLERAYAALPKEYAGFRKPLLAPVGGQRNGVFRTGEFYTDAVGSSDGRLSTEAWLRIPDGVLAEAVNGVIFWDNYGEFSEIRRRLLHMPLDVRKKRLAGNLFLMAQAGQYNFLRSLKHGEPEAASMALYQFVSAALKVVFLLREQYLPYYKWSFRALRSLPDGAVYASLLSPLLSGLPGNSPAASEEKAAAVEKTAALITEELCQKEFSDLASSDLERQAYRVNESIFSGEIREMPLLAGVS